TVFQPEDEGTEEYNPKLVVHQGDGLSGPLFALAKKSVTDESVRVIGRTYAWYVFYPNDPAYEPQAGPPEDPEILVVGGFDANEADLSPSWIPTAPHGTKLGLTVQQLCVKEGFGD